MVLDDIATAFTNAGLKTIATYSRYVPGCFPKNIKLTDYPVRILANETSDPNHDLAKKSNGKIKVIQPYIFIFDISDSSAVSNKLTWIKEIFKTVENKIGFQNYMPITYQGINFFLFEPLDGTIDETSEPFQSGIFVSSQQLLIAVEE